MYTTTVHPLRLALNLSMEEFAVLDKIYKLSNNIKYGGWCVASQTDIANWLGLPKSTVNRHINTLIEKELVEKDLKTKHLRSSDLWNEIEANSHDWFIGFDGKESSFVSGRLVQNKITGLRTESGSSDPKWNELSQNGTGCPKMEQKQVLHIEDNKKHNPPTPQRGECEEFLKRFNEVTSRSFKGSSKTQKSLNSRLKEGFTVEMIISAAEIAAKNKFLRGENESGKDYLTPDYILRPGKADEWLNSEKQPQKSRRYPVVTEEFLNNIHQ